MPEFDITNTGYQETDDFIKAPPSWIIRNGMILMIIIFTVLITGAYYIQYTDTIECKGVILAYPPPVRIYAPKSGRLSFINVKDSMKIKKNDIIAILNNNPSNQGMININKLINSMDTSKNIKGLLFDAEFCKVLKIIDTGKAGLEFIAKIKRMKAQLRKPFAEQSEISVRKTLFVLAEKIRKDVYDWKNKNTLMSPIDGFIYYLNDHYEDKNVNKGEALFAVVPNNYGYTVQVDVSPSSAAYIKKGQRCFIKIQEYPYQKFGLLIGTVSKINNLFNDSAYTVVLSAGKKLVTTKKVQIPDKTKYFINASIVIRNRSLLNRLISQHGN